MTEVDPLEAALTQLGYRENGGLVEGPSDDSVARSFVWRDLQKKAGVHAAYFRGAVPLVAFIRAEEDQYVRDVQRRLWNLGRVPLLIAATPDRIAAYSCVVTPPPNQRRLTALASTGRGTDLRLTLDGFSREDVEAGTPVVRRPSAFRRRLRVDISLLRNLRRLRNSLHGAQRRAGIDALIGRAIFVRYLEDRGILSHQHIDELVQQRSFIQVLGNGVADAYDFFERLADRFNGDVFAVSATERSNVTDSDLQTVAAFLAGTDIHTGQARLWPYEFAAIPPDLISSIYEQLLDDKRSEDAAYYTPRHVVDLVLDEVLPWSASRTMQPRVLDPACGSGNFLTESFRRIAFGMSFGSGGALSFADLANTLTESIWGIDRNEDAIRVSAFGLYLAMLEEVDPPTAWETARLPQLTGQNLIVADFFQRHSLHERQFDLVIGNPPWIANLTPAAESYVRTSKRPIANRQIAQAFAWRASELLATNGQIAMLMPAKSLLHNRSPRAVAVRRKLFEALKLQTVIDLSVVRRSTFSDAIGPGAVMVAGIRDSAESDHPVVHVAPKANTQGGAIDVFPISSIDVHEIPATTAATRDDVWKVLLWGDNGDLDLVSRLRSRHPSLREVAKNRTWVHGRGFELKGDRNPAPALKGMRFIATERVVPFAIRRGPREVVTAEYMHRPRSATLYRGPLVLVRRGLVDGGIAAAFVSSGAAYNNGVFGISGPPKDKRLLRLAVAYLNSAVAHYYQFLTNASWGVERDFIEASEHLSLPFPLPPMRTQERVLDALSAVEQAPSSESALRRLDMEVLAAYGLGEVDAQRIEDRLAFRLDQFRRGAGSIASRPVSQAALKVYASALVEACRLFSGDAVLEASAYSRNHYSVVELRMRGIAEVAHHERPSLESVIQMYEAQLASWTSTVSILSPAFVSFGGDTAVIVKPREAVNWTITAAYSDATDLVGSLAAGGSLLRSAEQVSAR